MLIKDEIFKGSCHLYNLDILTDGVHLQKKMKKKSFLTRVRVLGQVYDQYDQMCNANKEEGDEESHKSKKGFN